MRAPWTFVVLTLMGCGGTTLVVDSDTAWAGSVDAYGSISGRGNANYDLGDAARSCWAVGKTTDAGTLRVYAKTSEWFGIGDVITGESTTSAPRGTVTGCAR
jgi:hypothetical protein